MPKASTKILNQEDKVSNFEEAIAELEQVVVQLQGEIKLDEALELFDRGVKLSQICEKFLKLAEAKIEVLKKSANGSTEIELYADQSELIEQ